MNSTAATPHPSCNFIVVVFAIFLLVIRFDALFNIVFRRSDLLSFQFVDGFELGWANSGRLELLLLNIGSANLIARFGLNAVHCAIAFRRVL